MNSTTLLRAATGAPQTKPPHALARDLATHRRCQLEHAGMVRQLCRKDRSVLPRWHQDDRGTDNAHRGVHDVAPAGAYAAVTAWNGREHWLTVVVPVAIAINRAALKAEQVSPATFKLWATVESGYAQDQRTGRRCIVRPDTVASVMGMHVDVARTCRRIARRIGLQVVIRLGRMLTVNECTAARRRGSRQRGLSTETALTIPSPLRCAVDSATPTRGNTSNHQSHLSLGFLHAASGDQTEAAPPQPSPGRLRTRRKCRQLASDLIAGTPWLAGERPGRLAPALRPFVTCQSPWTPQNVRQAITDLTLRNGLGNIRPEKIRTRPAVLIASLLRQLDPEIDHPDLAILEQAADPTPPQPCGSADCDGHGWIHQLDGLVAKCPHCPPGIRSLNEDTSDVQADDEPPF